MGNIHLVTGYAGQEHVTAADMGAFNASVFGSGQYVTGNGNRLAASVVTNNQIRVLDGDIIMQGRHIRLNPGTYVDLVIESGAQGVLRNDLIVARYTKDSRTGVEDCNLVVITGTAAASDPSDPAYTSGDMINDNVLLNDMPLYRVPLDGLNIGELVPMFSVFEGTLISHKHAASDVASGTLATDRIPSLAASKITSGTFATDRIPALDAGKITSGTFSAERIPALGASKITSGTFSAERIPALATSKITSGSFGVARGGTGRSTLTSGSYLVGNGASAVTMKTKEQVKADLGIVEMVLVWENASPTSAFAGQVLSVDLSGFDAIIITAAETADNGTCVSLFYLLNRADKFGTRDAMLSCEGCFRYIEYINNTGIGFQNCSSSNANMIPYQIIGVKGVQTA